MTGTIPFGGITNTGQSTAQAVTASAAQLVFPNATAIGSPTTQNQGDPAVKADPTNNRVIVNAPGTYEVTVDIVGAAASALQTTCQLRKNGTVGSGSTGTAITGTKAVKTWGTTPDTFSWTSFIQIASSDLPSAGGVATFADPSASAGVGKPSGGFAGAGAAPLTGIPLDVLVTGNGSVNLTPTDMRLSVRRVG